MPPENFFHVSKTEYSDAGDGVRSGCPHCSKSSDYLPSSSSYYSYAIGDTNWDKIRRIILASIKGFSIGAGLKGGFSLFSLIARILRRNSSKSIKKNGSDTKTSEEILVVIVETLRYGLFLGTFAGTFTSVDEIIASLGGHRRTAKWRALVAGGIAGPSMLLNGLNTQHNSLAIYILMRATVLATRCGIKSKRFGHLCKPLTWSYGDVFLMCLSSSQILSAYILKQESLPPSYKSFLNKHGAKDMAILEGMKAVARHLPISNLVAIEKYYRSLGVDMTLDPTMKIPCSIVHGKQSCEMHFLSFLCQAYKRALPVYLPVYLIPALIVHRQDLLRRPSTILAKSAFGVARSSLFLSTYCASAWLWMCFLFRLLERCSIPLVALGTFPSGLAIAIEKKSKRIEISLYCLARAIDSFFTCMADNGYLPESLMKIKRADVAVFSISTAIIMHCYSQERDIFRSKYLNVLDWVFGVPPPPCYACRLKRGLGDERWMGRGR